jgi:hypothetical protein
MRRSFPGLQGGFTGAIRTMWMWITRRALERGARRAVIQSS